MNRRDASTASRNQMDELTKKIFHFTLSPCDFCKLKEWWSCDYMSSVLESGHWLKSGRGGRKQENILLRFSCVRLISSSSFTHLWKVMFFRHQSCPVWDSPLLPLQLGWVIHWARWMQHCICPESCNAFSASQCDLCWGLQQDASLWLLLP